MKFEVVVVGGGPAGALAGCAAAAAGAKTLVLERAPNRIRCCAGLVSPQTASRLKIPPQLVLREIRAVRVFSPEGRVAELRSDKPKGLVLDRPELDKWLRENAQEKGAEFWVAEARGLTDKAVSTTKGPVEFEVVIGADGAYSTMARAAGLPRPREILIASQAEVRVELKDRVEVYFGVMPDFFAWAVPEKEGIAKVGLATAFGRQALPRLRDFLGKKFQGCEVISVRSGLIPIGPPDKTSRVSVILTGNAAAQVKPLTGGGLAFLSQCAPLAGRAAALGQTAIQDYEEQWRKLIAKELRFQAKARQIFLRLPPKALEELVQTLGNPKLAEFLVTFGDIDNFCSLSSRIPTRPDLWPLLLPVAHWFS